MYYKGHVPASFLSFLADTIDWIVIDLAADWIQPLLLRAKMFPLFFFCHSHSPTGMFYIVV